MHVWPAVFMFKFVVPTLPANIVELKSIFGEVVEYSTRESRNGKYTSVTIKEMVLSADIIFERYEQASKIEGIISL
jgi:uncharacterized protein